MTMSTEFARPTLTHYCQEEYYGILQEARRAQEMSQGGHVRGKIVLKTQTQAEVRS